MKKFKLFQPYHLVSLSPWPIFSSLNLMFMLLSFIIVVKFLNYKFMGVMFISMALCLFQWWRDVVREGLFQGFHSFKVVCGLKLGMILFIVSEVFFFISIFWCYFHMFLSPSIELGGNWPPKNIEVFNPYLIPLINTVILLSSGVSITLSHYCMLNNLKFKSSISLLFTIFLGLIFTMFQYYEYYEASFSIADSVYGSIFYMATGFHGLHVLVGSMFLFVMFIRMLFNNFSMNHHLGFEMAAWYWHFVDVVWLFLYLLVYIFSY